MTRLMKQLALRAKSLAFARLAPRRHRLLLALSGGSGASPGMGRSLYRSETVFRESIEETGAEVEQVLGHNLAAHFRGRDDPAPSFELERRNDIARMGMLQIGQVDLWRAAGVDPGGVLAVSLGEMVAPYAAGALSRRDCARIVAAVSHAISRTARAHRMFLVRADRAAAGLLAASAPARLDYLGSSGVGISSMLCAETDAAAVRHHLAGLIVRELESQWNYHTPSLDVDRAWLQDQLSRVRSRPLRCPIYSAAAAGPITDSAAFDAQYFSWMVSHPFHFNEAFSSALEDGFDAILTLGSQPVQSGLMRAVAHSKGHDVQVIDSIREDADESAWRVALAAVHSLHIVTPVPRSIDPETIRLATGDDHIAFEQLRSLGPVHYLRQHDYWLVLGYDQVRAALAEPGLFSSSVKAVTDPVLLGSDPPRHLEVRRAVSRHFSPKLLAGRTRLARDTADRLLQPLREGREFDVVSDFAHPLVATVAADLVGLDRGDAEALSAAAAGAAGDLEDLYARMREPLTAIAPRSPLYAELLRDGIGEEEARSLIRLFWIAGTTTQHSIAPAVLLLLQNDDVRRRLLDDRSLLPEFVEESLRLHPPAHLIPRRTTKKAAIGGKAIPAGALVQLCLAAANRDPGRFPDPGSLRLDRPRNQHLSFGSGVHRCIGAPLGQAVMTAALEALFRVAPGFSAIQPLAMVKSRSGTTLREIEQLVIGA